MLAPATLDKLPELLDTNVPKSERTAKAAAAASLEILPLTEEELQWLDVISNGWASPLKGFMTEKQLLQTLHFSHLIMEDGTMSPMPVPVLKTCTTADKERLEGKSEIALTYGGKPI